jgi:hypothetical protein
MMMRFAIWSLLFALCACQTGKLSTAADAAAQTAVGQAAPQGAPTDSLFLLPGTFSQRTTVADLETRFGKSNVKISEVRNDDGTLERSVVLFPEDPARRAFVGFHDETNLSDLQSISVRDAGSLWRGKHGVHVGMSFADLRKVNGRPFWFSGFDSEHRGWVRDQWSPALDDDTPLGALDVDGEDHMYFGVDLGLRGQAKDIPVDAYPSDDSISSDDPRYPRLGEIVEVTAITATTSLDDEWE